MFKKLKGLILVLTTCLFLGQAAHADDSVSNTSTCDVYLNSDDVVVPKPFSSTICPNDKAVNSLLHQFPATMETAIKFANLKYKSDFLNEGDADSDIVGEVVGGNVNRVRNEIVNLEMSAMSIQKLALYLIGILIVVQFFSISLVALRSGEIGGKKFGLFKTFSRIAVGAILITPMPIESQVLGLTTDVMVIQVIVGLAVLVAISFSNIGISTIGYLASSSIVLDEDYSESLKDTSVSGLANLPSLLSRELIENALCAKQAAMVGVYESAKTHGVGARQTLDAGGRSLKYSTFGDGAATLIETKLGTSGSGDVITQFGFNLESNNKTSHLCSESVVKKPSFINIGKTKKEQVDFEELKSFIDKSLSKLTIHDLTSEKKLLSDWKEIENKAKNSANIRIDSISLSHLARYYFNTLRYIREGGLLASQDNDTYALFNKRASIANKIADLVVESRCYTDRLDFLNTKNSISALNSGSVGASDFTLKCAVVDEGVLKTPYQANTSSAEGYASDVIKVLNGSKYKLEDLYVELYNSFEKYSVATELAYAKVVRNITNMVSADSEEYKLLLKNYNLETEALREDGIAKLSYNFLSLFDQGIDLKNRQRGSAAFSTMSAKTVNQSVLFYSYDSNYLPKSVGAESLNDLTNYSIRVPEFIYVTPVDDMSIEEKIESQLFTSQGGSFTGGGNREFIDNTNEDGAVFNKLGKTQTNSLNEIILSEQQNVFEQFMQLINQVEKEDSDIYQDVVSHCFIKNGKEIIEDKYGDKGLEIMEKSCLSYRDHFLFETQDRGVKAIDFATIALASWLGGKVFAQLAKKRDELKKSAAEDGGLDSNGGSKAATGNKAHLRAMASSFANREYKEAAKSMGKILVSEASFSAAAVVAGWVAVILMLIGVIQAIILPLIPVLAHLLSYIGWYMLVCQLMIISSIIAATFFMFLDQDDQNTAPEKASYGVFSNIIIRPFALVVGLVVGFILTFVAFVIMDLTTINMTAGMKSATTTFMFNPIRWVLDIMVYLTILIAYIYVIKTIFEISVKAPNNIIRKLGAESLESRESKTSEFVFAAAVAANDKLADQAQISDLVKKKQINDIIKESNRNDERDLYEIAEAAKYAVTPLVLAARDKIVETKDSLSNRFDLSNESSVNSTSNANVSEKSVTKDAKTNSEELNKKQQKDEHGLDDDKPINEVPDINDSDFDK